MSMLGVLSDIHGNLPALEQALEIGRHHGVEDWIWFMSERSGLLYLGAPDSSGWWAHGDSRWFSVTSFQTTT